MDNAKYSADRQRLAYDQVAKSKYAGTKDLTMGFSHNEFPEEMWIGMFEEYFNSALNDGREPRSLDLMPGSGNMSKLLSQYSKTSYIEFSEEMFALCKQRAPLANGIQGDVTKLSFPQKNNIVFWGHGIHMIPNQLLHGGTKIHGQVIPKLRSSLEVNKGAVFFTTTLHDEFSQAWRRRVEHDKTAEVMRYRVQYTLKDLKEIFSDGFKQVEEIILQPDEFNKRFALLGFEKE
jgi:hypothetical protein